MDEAGFVLRNVSKTFRVGGLFEARRHVEAVKGVSVRVAKGEVIGIVGESGSGKTTVARMMLNLVKPTAGDILFEGTHVSRWSRLAFTRRVQPVFQDPYSSLNPRQSIGKIISMPLRVHAKGDAATRTRTTVEMMELVGLPRRLYHHYPNQLSGGQRQRVAIARALVLKPTYLICDEPTSALDVSIQAQILNLLLDLRRELDLTYVVVSHNLAVIEHIATRVVVMQLGEIVEENATAAVFSAPSHPYTRLLLDSILIPFPPPAATAATAP